MITDAVSQKIAVVAESIQHIGELKDLSLQQQLAIAMRLSNRIGAHNAANAIIHLMNMLDKVNNGREPETPEPT